MDVPILPLNVSVLPSRSRRRKRVDAYLKRRLSTVLERFQTECLRDVEELKKPIHPHQRRCPTHKYIYGFLQIGENLAEEKAHVDDARHQHDPKDAVDKEVLLPRQETGGIYGENPDDEDGLGADGNEVGEDDKGLDAAPACRVSEESVFLCAGRR